MGVETMRPKQGCLGRLRYEYQAKMAASLDDQLWPSAQKVLSETFKLQGFRDGQEDIIRSILSGHDTLAVMPTGSGKSLCYQLPGVVLPGITLVISPLIALMKDQVDSLLAKGIRAANLHSGLEYGEQQAICRDVVDGRVKFLFVAPERVRNANFQSLLNQVKIGLLAVDEAHCISQWGHDFRPDYRRLSALRQALGNPPTIALTATASPTVQRDIVEQLALRDPGVFILGFDRLNLRFGVKIFKTEREKLAYAYDFVSRQIQNQCGFKRQYPGCGIIYASTIKLAENAASYLKERGIRAGLYHAGLSPAMRTQVQEQFMNDEFHCLIATTAFGMGVDKPNIRYVLHLSMSSSVEAYTQESGRAGRDRLPAECMLLFSGVDAKIQEHFIDGGCPDLTIYRTLMELFADSDNSSRPKPGQRLEMKEILDHFERKQLQQVDTALRKLRAQDVISITPDGLVVWNRDVPADYAKSMARESDLQKKVSKTQLKNLIKYVYDGNCRTKFILKYFGSRDANRFKCCNHCDLCNALPNRPQQGIPGPFPPEPVHYVLLKYLSTLARCQNAHLPVNTKQIAAILTGSTGEPALTKISTFGLLDYLDPAEIPVLTGALRDAGLVVSQGAFVALTARGIQLLGAKKLADFPPTLQHYISLRFPHAEKQGGAYHP